MKKVLSTVLASCILLSVAACGQPGSSSTEPQSSTISEETSQTSQPASGETVEFWDMIWGSDADAYEKAVRGICDVVEQEIGAEVKTQFLPWDNFVQVYIQRFHQALRLMWVPPARLYLARFILWVVL